ACWLMPVVGKSAKRGFSDLFGPAGWQRVVRFIDRVGGQPHGAAVLSPPDNGLGGGGGADRRRADPGDGDQVPGDRVHCSPPLGSLGSSTGTSSRGPWMWIARSSQYMWAVRQPSVTRGLTPSTEAHRSTSPSVLTDIQTSM